MPHLLGALGFTVNEHSRRAPCLLHGGRNPTAFSWREDGLWHCFSCDKGGDKIALIRAVHRCSFRDAVNFLAALGGARLESQTLSSHEIAEKRKRHANAKEASLGICDSIIWLRREYAQRLIRCERLLRTCGTIMKAGAAGDDPLKHARLWDVLGILAPLSTHYLAALNFLDSADTEMLVRYVLGTTEQREMIFSGEEDGFAQQRDSRS